MSKKKKYTAMVAVMVTPETLKQLNEITDEIGISNSEFIRKIVEEKLNQKNFNEQEK